MLDVYGTLSGPGTWNQDISSFRYLCGVNQFWTLEELDFGAAPSYASIQTASADINCAGFALRIDDYLTKSKLKVNDWDSVQTVAKKTIAYFEKTQSGRTIQRIPGVNIKTNYPIASNEYRVALRVTTTGSQYDYHYMIQLDTGEWAHKIAGYPSKKLGYIDPNIYDWYNYYAQVDYDSDVIYFAVSR